MLRKTAAALALTVAVAMAGPAFAESLYPAGKSSPIEDSYYPSKGNAEVDVLHYGLALDWKPKHKMLTATANLAIRPTVSARNFQLDLGKPLHVRGVKVDGTKATYKHVGKTLTVKRAVTVNKDIRVRILYRGKPKPVPAPTSRRDQDTLGWHTTKTGQVWAMQEPFGAFTWYPVNDNPSDKAMYDVRITAPKGFVGISNGSMTSRKKLRTGRTLTSFSNSDPMASYLVTIAIGPYRHYTKAGPHGLPMSFWVPKAHPEYVKPLLKTGKAVKWLESKLGRYPFDRVGIVVTPSQSAMETQTMVTFGSDNYRYGNFDVRATVAHELAHAWYGDTVTPKDWRDLWMNEGFAMYLQARFSVHEGWSTWSSWTHEFSQNDAYWRELYGPPGKYGKRQFAQINVYYCTARMLIRLRSTIGAPAFNSALKAWPQEHLNKSATRAGYVDWLNARTHKDLTSFFNTWLNSTAAPK